MTRRFVRGGNDHGEWTIMDRVLGYRICTYHRDTHHGVHVHIEPGDEVVGTLPPITVGRADAAVRRFATRHEQFEFDTFRREVRLWRSR